MNTIVSLLLAVSVILGPLSAALPLQEDAVAAIAPGQAQEVEDAPGALSFSDLLGGLIMPGGTSTALRDLRAARGEDRGTVPYGEMEYVHYDPEAFYDEADRMCAEADAGNSGEVIALYDELYDEFLYIDALSTLAMLRYDADFRDEYWNEEYSYSYDLWTEAEDALMSACAYVLDGPCARDFTAHIGMEAAMSYRGYTSLTDDGIDAYDRQLVLLDDYYDLYDTIGDVSCEYKGEIWTLDRFSENSDVLASLNYGAYIDIYYGLQQALAETFGPLFIELVELRTQIARDAGYDSYTDYAYELVYQRDYDPDEAQRFCDAVKPVARQYYGDLYYSDISYGADTVRPVLGPEELVETLGEYMPRISPALEEPWQCLSSRGLYDLAPGSSGRYDGCYTTAFLYYGCPFIYGTLYNDCYDLIGISHEFGHFCDYYFSPQTNILIEIDDLDLSEIHSNALQALLTTYYGEIYDRGADVAEFINLSHLLENVLDGCMQDEFQRRVYADPDDLTVEKLNAIYTELGVEYGMYSERPTWDSGWVYVSHTFERPLYYISYAASGIAALQIWAMAQDDFDGAVDVYLDVLSYGAHSYGYGTVLSRCGLRLFTEDGVTEAVCAPVLDRLYELDREYG